MPSSASSSPTAGCEYGCPRTWHCLRVSAHLALSIAEQLAGWGAAVEVLEPEAVRAELARLGAELVSRYGGR